MNGPTAGTLSCLIPAGGTICRFGIKFPSFIIMLQGLYNTEEDNEWIQGRSILVSFQDQRVFFVIQSEGSWKRKNKE